MPMFEIRHQLPGRLRLRVPAIAAEPDRADAMAALLRAQTGVRRVRINPACASLLIEFSPALHNAPLITARVRALWGYPAVLPPPTALSGRRTERRQRALPRDRSAPIPKTTTPPRAVPSVQAASAGHWWQQWGQRWWRHWSQHWSQHWSPRRRRHPQAAGVPALASAPRAAWLPTLRLPALWRSAGGRPMEPVTPALVPHALARRMRARATAPAMARSPARAAAPDHRRRPTRLTLLHARAARWVVRSTLRCWWEEFHDANRSGRALTRPAAAGR